MKSMAIISCIYLFILIKQCITHKHNSANCIMVHLDKINTIYINLCFSKFAHAEKCLTHIWLGSSIV